MKRFDPTLQSRFPGEAPDAECPYADMEESKDGDYILYSDFVKALAMIYNDHYLDYKLIKPFPSTVVAHVCDEHLDKSGALLGEVRDAAEKLRKGE